MHKALLVVFIAAVFRLSAISVPRVNVDEGWSWYLVANPTSDVMWYLQKDRHPPLPFLMLQAVRSHNEFLMRLPFALVGIASVLVAFLLGRRLFDTRVGLGASLLTAVSFLAWEYDTWMRGYVLLTFFSLASTLAFAEVVRRDCARRTAWAVAYAACGVGLLYSQYLGILTLAGHFFVSLLRDPEDRWLPLGERLKILAGCWIAMLVMFAPWLPMLKLQLGSRAGRGDLAASGVPTLAMWMGLRLLPLETGLDNLPLLLGLREEGARMLFASAVSVACGWFLIAGARVLRRDVMSFRLLLAMLVPPLLYVILIGVKFPELSRIRYYVPYVAYFGMLLTAGGLSSRAMRSAGLVLAAVIVVVNAAVLASYLQSSYFRTADWQAPARYAAAHEGDARAIVGFDNYAMHAFNYYYAGDLLRYDVRDRSLQPKYEFSPEYRGLPQHRAWVQEVPDGLEATFRGVDRVLLMLWMDYGNSPVRQWFAQRYDVRGGQRVENFEMDGQSETYLLEARK